MIDDMRMYVVVSILLIIIAILLITLYHYQEQLNEKFFGRSVDIMKYQGLKKEEDKNVVRYEYKPSPDQLKNFIKNNKGPYTECLIYIEKEWSSKDNWYLLCSDKYYAPTGLLYVHGKECIIEGIPKSDIYIKNVKHIKNDANLNDDIIKNVKI